MNQKHYLFNKQTYQSFQDALKAKEEHLQKLVWKTTMMPLVNVFEDEDLTIIETVRS